MLAAAGYNVCIFAYGQTGSGKTHTMSGTDVQQESGRGINYRALDDLFDLQRKRAREVSWLECNLCWQTSRTACVCSMSCGHTQSVQKIAQHDCSAECSCSADCSGVVVQLMQATALLSLSAALAKDCTDGRTRQALRRCRMRTGCSCWRYTTSSCSC